MDLIARRNATATNRHTNESGAVCFELLKPYPIDNGTNYMCLVRISGLHQEELTVGGIDAMQAILLAAETIRNRFEELHNETYDFYWPDSYTPNSPMESLDYRISDE